MPLPPVIAVVGTTASGKSELAIELALRLGGEIVSADSRQVYRGLDLGSGKVTLAERARVPHHLLDVADVRQRFTVAEFQRHAFAAIDRIHSRGRVPVLVGGSGLYVRAVVDNPEYPAVEPHNALREDLERTPLPALVARLRDVDAAAAASIDLHNPRRVVRALEVTLASGVPSSAQRRLGAPRVSALQLGLTWPRDELRRRIESRVDARLASVPSMLDEVRGLLESGVPSSRLHELGLEYRFLAAHVLDLADDATTSGQLKTAIYQFAKRQLTWFKRDTRIQWLTPERALEEASRLASSFLNGL